MGDFRTKDISHIAELQCRQRHIHDRGYLCPL